MFEIRMGRELAQRRSKPYRQGGHEIPVSGVLVLENLPSAIAGDPYLVITETEVTELETEGEPETEGTEPEPETEGTETEGTEPETEGTETEVTEPETIAPRRPRR